MSRVSFFALLLALPTPARAGADYFVLMFGAQAVPADPNYSHSFATFVRVTWTGDAPCPHDPCIEAHTISWLPSNMVVRAWAPLPESGTNFDLHSTVGWCQENAMRVSLWGPYRICPDLYYLALRHKAHLESGAVRYKAVDTGRDSAKITNCIHALADVVDGRRLRVGTPGWGQTASFVVLNRYEPFIRHPGCAHPWIGNALGLDAHPLIYRDWQRPRSGLFGPIYRLLGGERDLQATYGPPVRQSTRPRRGVRFTPYAGSGQQWPAP